MKQLLQTAASVRPSARQLAWFDTAFYAFIHYGMNTYTNMEWGTGQEDPALFCPIHLDCDGWVEAVKAAGMKGLILTAKHHDGFCLWRTNTTEHCVRNSPYPGDVVREAAEACCRGGIRFGVYLSPWDRNSQLYGTPAYNDYYKAQLTELLTRYGDIFCVWLDGACGEGPNGKRQEYDFQGYIDIVRKYQPGAAIMGPNGADARWIGNEAGRARQSEWAVIPFELGVLAQDTVKNPAPLPGGLPGIHCGREDLGVLSNILYSEKLCFMGAEADTSLRPGWFYHPNEAPRPLDELFRIYCTTVGGNACLNLNVPPMPSGQIDPRDVRRLQELGDAIRAAFGQNVIQGTLPVRHAEDTNSTVCTFSISLPHKQQLRYISLAEDLWQGQLVESFSILNENEEPIFEGTTIGHLKICPVDAAVEALHVRITAARGPVHTLNIQMYD